MRMTMLAVVVAQQCPSLETETPDARVEALQGVVARGVPLDLVEEAVAIQIDSLDRCVEPHTQGRLDLGWGIRDGRVYEYPYVIADHLGDPSLVACVLPVVAAWRFPRNVDGDLAWSIVFSGGAAPR